MKLGAIPGGDALLGKPLTAVQHMIAFVVDDIGLRVAVATAFDGNRDGILDP